ncbi:unnamed protein product [Schistosoma margrebowiei]|uniref:Uncharacterized protein n=1 Tax=Schistosoma margrebowiei TaxID=48269 RepID=A0A183MFF5_9TREM|nr:unnamed protein product [Schistosoma margrebowiei]
MVVGGSQQETLDSDFVLPGTRQQDVPVILNELVLADGFDPVSPSLTVRDVTTGLSGPRPTSCADQQSKSSIPTIEEHWELKTTVNQRQSQALQYKYQEHITPRNGDRHEKNEQQLDGTRKEGPGQSGLDNAGGRPMLHWGSRLDISIIRVRIKSMATALAGKRISQSVKEHRTRVNDITVNRLGDNYKEDKNETHVKLLERKE